MLQFDQAYCLDMFRRLLAVDSTTGQYEEIQALIGVPQNPRFHNEGDVWNHTMLVLDAAAQYREQTENPFGFMLSALTHDLGKVTATEYETGKFHAYGHETAGLPMAEAFLRRITNEKELIDYVLNLTQLHMKPTTIVVSGASLKTSNHMFDDSIDPEGLIYLSMADGQGTRSPYPYVSSEENLRARLQIYRETMAQPYVMGRDLIEAACRHPEGRGIEAGVGRSQKVQTEEGKRLNISAKASPKTRNISSEFRHCHCIYIRV